MATGTSITHPTYDWTVRTSAAPDPVIIGDDIQVYAATSGRFVITGYVWCHIDPVTDIPAGATITSIDSTLNVMQSSSVSDGGAGFHQSPSVNFATESAILAGGVPFGYGVLGAGGPGDLPFDTASHTITYDGLLYPSQSGGGGIFDFQGWVDALGAPDPLGMLVQAQAVRNGQYLEYDAPWTFTIYWEAPATIQPPLRQIPRTDGLGASSAPRHYPPSRSVQASNRRAGGYL